MNAIWIFNSYFYQIEPSRLRLTLVASEIRHAWFNIVALV